MNFLTSNANIVRAINKLSNTVADNNDTDIEVKVAIISVVVTVIGIIVTAGLTVFINNYNRSNSNYWNKRLYKHDLGKMSATSVRIFSKDVWRPLKQHHLLLKFKSGHLSNQDKKRLARIVGSYRRWTIYLNGNITNTKLTKKDLTRELTTLKEINGIIKMSRKRGNKNE